MLVSFSIKDNDLNFKVSWGKKGIFAYTFEKIPSFKRLSLISVIFQCILTAIRPRLPMKKVKSNSNNHCTDVTFLKTYVTIFMCGLNTPLL